LAAIAVWPRLKLSSVTRAAEIDAAEPLELERDAAPAPVCVEEPERGHVRRQIEAFDRERALQGLAAVGDIGQPAFAGIAVEFEIDLRQRDIPAGDAGLRLEREALEAGARRRLVGRPAQSLTE
jgi:hypothetical protein